MIASIAFRKFKALRNTRVELAPFNVVIGPNGSGKTSLIEALLRLRALAQRTPDAPAVARTGGEGPEISFEFQAPHGGIVARLGCGTEMSCDALCVEPPGAPGWPSLRATLIGTRNYALNHAAMAVPGRREEGRQLAPDGGNLAAVLACLQAEKPDVVAALSAEMARMLPEFKALEIAARRDGTVGFGLVLEEDGLVPAEDLSQGTLYLLGMLALAYDPSPPRILCIEEVDRGLHPRMLREVRDALYRLSYPDSCGSGQPPVQLIATTHSPYFIDLFRDHPDEVIISHKCGRTAHFERLVDRPDLPELLREGALGDMWFSGVLGGVPEER